MEQVRAPAHPHPNTAERCLYPPFPKGKNHILGELCGFPAWGTRTEPGTHATPPPALTPLPPSPVQSPRQFSASPPRQSHPGCPHPLPFQPTSPGGGQASPRPRAGHSRKNEWGEHPSLPILLGREGRLLTKTKAPFAQRHQPFGSPARACGSSFASPPPRTLPAPPGGESQPPSSSLGKQGACQKEHRAFSTGM